jgi:hypothetical protein
MFRPELLDRSDPSYLTSSWASFEQLLALTRAAQASGWQTGGDPAVLAGVLWAAVHGIAALWVQGSLPAATGATSFDVFVDVFQLDLAGLPGERTPR